MSASRRVAGLAVLAAIVPLAAVLAQAPKDAGPLAEEKLVRLLELKIKDPVIASMIQKQGVGFAADAATLDRLKKAGASEALLDAVVQAGKVRATPAGRSAPSEPAVTFKQLREMLELGVPESEILARLKESPTAFQLGDKEIAELKGLGASENLLGTLKSVRTPLDAASEISNLAIVLDCSGSMSEKAPQGPTKMDAARRATIELIQKIPEGVRLTFVIYGHDRAQECNAVQVVRPLSPIDRAGKEELIRLVGRLQPTGSTPIAMALRAAGQELARAKATSGVVLISDGKEMCGGDPVSEATTLARNLSLGLGVQVVGFGVKPEERKSLEEIAQAGRGKYFDAPTPAALLRDVIPLLAAKIQQEATPAREGPRIPLKRRGQARTVTVQSPAIQLPPLGKIYLTETGSNIHHAVDYHAVARSTAYGQNMRIPPANKEQKFDLWWVPRDKELMSVKLVADLSVPLEQAEGVVVKPEEHLGLVRLMGGNLPATKQVFLGPPNYGQSVAKFIAPHKVQKAAKYGQDLVVPAGTYNLWISPVDEDAPEVVAEKLEVKPGKVTVVE